MPSSKTKIYFVLTVIVGVITAFMVMNYLKGLSKAANVSEPMTKIVVAAKSVPSGTKIVPDMLKSIEIPVKYVHRESVKDPQKILNQFTTVDLVPDQVILNTQIISPEKANQLTYRIPAGLRAITTSINAPSGVAGFVKPGDHIDVLFNYKKTDQPDDNTVMTMLQNVLVLATGPNIQRKDGAEVTETITLALTPQDAEKIALAESSGKIKLTLRPADEKEKVSVPSIDFKGLKATQP